MTGRDPEQDVFIPHTTSVSVPPQLSSLGRMNTTASWAEPLARALLQEPLPAAGHTSRRRRTGTQPGTYSRRRRRSAGSRRMAARHRLRVRPGRDGLPPTRRRPLPARCSARRRPAVPAGRPPLLRHHRSRRTRTRRCPDPGVRARAARAFQRADLLPHDHQPGQRARACRTASGRDPSPLRPRAPGEPVNPARHADDPPRSRAGPRQSRPKHIAPQTGTGTMLSLLLNLVRSSRGADVP